MEGYTGGLIPFGGGFSPPEWTSPNGAPVQLTEDNELLLVILAYQFGGSGDTFNLPNLNPLTTVDNLPVPWILCLSGDSPLSPMLGIIGEVRAWPNANRVPPNWVLCNGGQYSSQTYPAAFAVLGTTFGGTESQFAVPNLPDLAPNIPYIICLAGIWPGQADPVNPLDYYLATVLSYAGTVPLSPMNFANLSTEVMLSINNNQALYALLGNNYGGNQQQDSFGLPNLAPLGGGKIPYFLTINGIFPPRE